VRRLSEPAGPYRNQELRFSSQDAVCTPLSAYPSTSSAHRSASVLAPNRVGVKLMDNQAARMHPHPPLGAPTSVG